MATGVACSASCTGSHQLERILALIPHLGAKCGAIIGVKAVAVIDFSVRATSPEVLPRQFLDGMGQSLREHQVYEKHISELAADMESDE